MNLPTFTLIFTLAKAASVDNVNTEVLVTKVGIVVTKSFEEFNPLVPGFNFVSLSLSIDATLKSEHHRKHEKQDINQRTLKQNVATKFGVTFSGIASYQGNVPSVNDLKSYIQNAFEDKLFVHLLQQSNDKDLASTKNIKVTFRSYDYFLQDGFPDDPQLNSGHTFDDEMRDISSIRLIVLSVIIPVIIMCLSALVCYLCRRRLSSGRTDDPIGATISSHYRLSTRSQTLLMLQDHYHPDVLLRHNSLVSSGSSDLCAGGLGAGRVTCINNANVAHLTIVQLGRNSRNSTSSVQTSEIQQTDQVCIEEFSLHGMSPRNRSSDSSIRTNEQDVVDNENFNCFYPAPAEEYRIDNGYGEIKNGGMMFV